MSENMPVCNHCSTFTSDNRRDPNSAVFPCRKCGEDLNASVGDVGGNGKKTK